MPVDLVEGPLEGVADLKSLVIGESCSVYLVRG